MWQTKLYPELLLVDTDAERKKLLRDARVWGRGVRWSWRRLLVVLGMLAGSITLDVFLLANGYVSGWSELILVGGVTTLIGLWGLEWMWRRPVRDELRRELIARGIPVCLHCGHSLIGLSEPRCPECGTKFDPQESAV